MGFSSKKELIAALSCFILVLLSMAALRTFSPSARAWRKTKAFNAAGTRNQLLLLDHESLARLLAPLSLASNFSMDELTSLYAILNKAAFHNRTVILTILNQAWAAQGSIFDLFLQSFADGEGINTFLNHLVVVCLDQVSAERCATIPKVYCFTLRTNGVDFSGEKFFMSEDYLKMMWRRIEFLTVVLEMGFSFIFTDADVLWFRNPFPYLSNDADIEIACDRYYGDPYALYNDPNGGYVHVNSRSNTIQLYKFWYKAQDWFPGKHDQDVLNKIKGMPSFRDIGVKIRFLTTEVFGGFCQVSKNFDRVATMHANCCTGLARKVNDLNLTLEDWKRYKSLTKKERRSKEMLWRAPKECKNSFHR